MESLIKNQSNHVIVYRYLAILGSIAYVIFGYFNHFVLTYESLIVFKIRILSASVFLLIFILSFKSNFFEKYIYEIIHYFSYLLLSIDYYLGIDYRFIFDHLLSLLPLYLIACVLIRNIKHLTYFLIYNILFFSIAVFLTKNIAVEPYTLVTVFILLSIVLFMVLLFQLNLQKNADLNAAQLLTIFNNSNQTISLLDLNYKILKVNEKAQEVALKHYKRRINDGESFLDFIPEQLKNEYENHFASCKNGNEIKYERGADNGTFYEFRFTPIFSSNNKVIAIAVFTLDITERYNTINELINSKKKIRENF